MDLEDLVLPVDDYGSRNKSLADALLVLTPWGRRRCCEWPRLFGAALRNIITGDNQAPGSTPGGPCGVPRICNRGGPCM